ncbi:MAG TPA: peptide deformylase [Actinobacteria bacterium]|nr:peptide deformylase [Actinomycetota bacterium]
MSVQPIRLFGDPVLRSVAEPVTVFDKELHNLVADLMETMTKAPGGGLAAPQIGVQLRVFTYDDGEGNRGHLINPDLSLTQEEQEEFEGCLSFPDVFYAVKRAYGVVARGQDMHGDAIEVKGTGYLARALQHETDHLDGVLFIDRLDDEARKLAMREIRQSEWFGVEPPAIKVSPHPMLGNRF